MGKISSDQGVVSSAVSGFRNITVENEQANGLSFSNLNGMQQLVSQANQIPKVAQRLVSVIQESADKFNQVASKKAADDQSDRQGFGAK